MLRLLQLVGDLLDESLDLIFIPGNKLVLLLNGEALLAESDNVKSGILVTTGGVNDGLEKATSLGEERLCSLLRSGVGANTADNVDSLKVAALGEQVHAGHGSALDISSDGDGQHGLASLVTNQADEVQRSGGGIKTQSEGVEDDAGLGCDLSRG
jgi:hypothetical protein